MDRRDPFEQYRAQEMINSRAYEDWLKEELIKFRRNQSSSSNQFSRFRNNRNNQERSRSNSPVSHRDRSYSPDRIRTIRTSSRERVERMSEKEMKENMDKLQQEVEKLTKTLKEQDHKRVTFQESPTYIPPSNNVARSFSPARQSGYEPRPMDYTSMGQITCQICNRVGHYATSCRGWQRGRNFAGNRWLRGRSSRGHRGRNFGQNRGQIRQVQSRTYQNDVQNDLSEECESDRDVWQMGNMHRMYMLKKGTTLKSDPQTNPESEASQNKVPKVMGKLKTHKMVQGKPKTHKKVAGKPETLERERTLQQMVDHRTQPHSQDAHLMEKNGDRDNESKAEPLYVPLCSDQAIIKEATVKIWVPNDVNLTKCLPESERAKLIKKPSGSKTMKLWEVPNSVNLENHLSPEVFRKCAPANQGEGDRNMPVVAPKQPHHSESKLPVKHLNSHQNEVVIRITSNNLSELINVDGKLVQLVVKDHPKGVNLHLSLLMTIMIIMSLITGTSSWPMLCTNTQGRTQWKIPDIKECNELIRNDHIKRPQPGTLQLYKRNHLQYNSKAWVCKRMRQEKQLYTYFWNTDHLEKYTVKQVPISEEDCQQMIQFRRSSKGSLTLKDGIWQTPNELKYEMPPGFYACCRWVKYVVENDFLYPTTVWKDHDVENATSSIGSISHCKYQVGKCQLHSGSYLLWEPNKTENCQYLDWLTITGHTYGRFFVADNKNIAFSLEDLEISRDCKSQKILIPPQGIPFRIIRSQEPYLRRLYQGKERLKRQKQLRLKRQT